MSIKYTVTTTTYKCPHCGMVLEQKSDEWWTLLVFLLLPLVFVGLILWGIKSLLDKIFNYDSIKIGDPYFKCKHCGKEVRSNDTFEWGELAPIAKHNWAFRHLMRINYLLGTILVVFIFLLVVCLTDNNSSDDLLLVVSIIFVLTCFVLLFLIFHLRNQSFRNRYITLCYTDYDFIKESWVRLHERYPSIMETETIKIWGTDKIILPLKSANAGGQNNNKQYDKSLRIWANMPNNEKHEDPKCQNRFDSQSKLPSPGGVVETSDTSEASNVSIADHDDCDYHLCPECGWEVFDDEERCSVCGRKNEKELNVQDGKDEHKNVRLCESPNDINISLSKQKKLSQMFGVDYGDIISIQEMQINNKKGLLYIFNPEKISIKNSFYAIFELNTQKHRYFALESFFSSKSLGIDVYALFEWARDENSNRINRINRRMVGESIRVISGKENPIDRMMEYIGEDICNKS